jgi:excisionase family DNA binding protein
MQNVHFTPPKLAELFGVNESTIKRWIDKGMLEATKSPGGHRRVTQEQLDTFIQNFPKNAPKSYVISHYIDGGKRDVDWREYYTCLLKNTSGKAKDMLNTAKVNQYTLVDQLEKIIQPALVHVGAEWGKQNISIYQEHRMTFLVRQQLEHLRQLYPSAADNGKHAILACAPGDHHELPLQMTDLLLHEDGWKTSVLGINISHSELLAAIEAVEPDMICVSSIVGQIDEPYVQSLKRYQKKSGCSVIFGGTQWNGVRLGNAIQTVTSFTEFSKVLG